MTDIKDRLVGSWKYFKYSMKEAFKSKPVDRLDLGRPCEWEDIKVGEIFGASGCFNILYKTSSDKDKSVLISDDFRTEWYENFYPGDKLTNLSNDFLFKKLYKLPKETQELWLPSEDNF